MPLEYLSRDDAGWQKARDRIDLAAVTTDLLGPVLGKEDDQ